MHKIATILFMLILSASLVFAKDKARAIVEKLMVVKRHFKRGRNPAHPEGGIVEKNGSIHLSNLALIDPESKKPTRVGTKLLENGKRVRIAKRSGAQIDQ